MFMVALVEQPEAEDKVMEYVPANKLERSPEPEAKSAIWLGVKAFLR